MKKTLFLVAILAFVSCKKEEVKKEPLYPVSTEEIVQSPEEFLPEKGIVLPATK